MTRPGVGAFLGVFGLAGLVGAGTIATDVLQRHPWPREWAKEFEVGRAPVVWRQGYSRTDGIFGGVVFTAPLPRQQVWELANDYTDIGLVTPGVQAVRFLEQTPTRQVIQIDVKVLWKDLRLTFEVEQEPPRAIRFRLANRALGEYRGLCRFEERAGAADSSGETDVELSTWLQPARPVPARLLLLVQRMTFLRGVRGFLESCEQQRRAPGTATAAR